MSPRLKPKFRLSTRQQNELVDIISDQFGHCLDKTEFSDQVHLLFEDIPGFETISDADSETVINQIWSRYHHGQT